MSSSAPAPPAPAATHHALTHAGLVHHENEDSWAIFPTSDGGMVYAVCDGMGGMGHGDLASQLAIRIISEGLTAGDGDPVQALLAVLQRADVVVRQELCGGGRGLPGTTAVITWLSQGRAHVAWVGDSRAYWIRDGVAMARTRDHKLVEELVLAGQLTEEEAKNSALAHVVTRAIGGRPIDDAPVEGSVLEPWEVAAGDQIVLCSDGLCDLVGDAEIATAIAGKNPEEAAKVLVDLALARGGHDNITVIALAFARPSVRARSPGSLLPEEEFASANRDIIPWLVLGGTVGALTVGMASWMLS